MCTNSVSSPLWLTRAVSYPPISLRELRAQIERAGGERQAEVEKAAKLLGSGVERERWARAEKQALEDRIVAVKGELVTRKWANRKCEFLF
jgi:hypothetical protein